MNVIFLTLAYPAERTSNLYTELLDEFVKNGDRVWVVCQSERRTGEPTKCDIENGKTVLRVKTLNITGNVGVAEKGVATATIDKVFTKAIGEHLNDVEFDLILYSTPPITLCGCVKKLKHKYNAKTYLLLKDIFPQNAVDMGMMKTSGVKGIIYHYFRKKEKELYALSDHIGCMSQANYDYVIKHNLGVNPEIVEVCPNSIIPKIFEKSQKVSIEQRKKYGIPEDAVTFIYGGNLGVPQGITFIVECLKRCAGRDDCFFFICGMGTDFPLLEAYINEEQPSNIRLFSWLPKDEYDALLQACDVGLLFLNHRFTIPNFPSRMLSYMEHSMPILACTDPNTDVGQVITESNFGWWCESNSAEGFNRTVDEACCADLSALGSVAYDYLTTHYTVEKSYEIIMEKLK